MFHRLAGIAVTEQFVQVCAVRRASIRRQFLICRSKQQQLEHNTVMQAMRMQAGACKKAPLALHNS